MKHVSKSVVLALVLLLAIGIFAGCNRVTGLTMENEAIGSPETVARNKEPYSATLIPYESAEQALGGDFTASPYYQSLNGTWDFTLVNNPSLIPEGFETAKFTYAVEDFAPVRKSENDAVTWGTIAVPSNWEMQGYDAPSYTYNSYTWDAELTAPNISESYNPVGIYRKNVNVPSDWSDRQVYVSFDGVASCVYVYVNGALIGYGEDSYTGKTFNITDAVEFGKDNLVVFVVYKFCDASYLEANDSIKYGGIYRDVYLYSAPTVQLRDLTYDMQMSGTDALMNLTVQLASYEKDPGSDYTVDVSVYDAEGKRVLDPTVVGTNAVFPSNIATTANAYVCTVGGRVTVSSPTLWSAETPALYTVVLELKDGDDVVDVVSKRIGFKTVGVVVEDSGKQTFVINDRSVILRGVLYNENSPVNGMAMTREEMVKDILMMKELNVNAVRSPGRPLSERFLSLCDEYGLYVVDDMSLNSNPYSNEDELSIPGDQSVWQTACLDRLLNVVYRDKNSASVIMWCVGNDSGTGSNFSVLRSWLSANDARMILYDDDNSASDLVICADLSLNDMVQVLSDDTNKKAVLFQDTNGALLNNGGNFAAYADLIDEYQNFQGGFFGYWSDNAIYWPTNASEANELMQTSSYNEETASSYRLTYAGGWGETTSTSKTYKALAGIVTADRQKQSDADELKNALSPVYITAVDAAKGEFRVTNRDSFTDFAGKYEISYEICEGANSVKSGKVEGLTLKAGTSETFTVDYGAIPANTEYYVYFTVKYTKAPAWMDGKDADLTVFAKQWAVTDVKTVPKDGSVQPHDGSDLALTVFQTPEVYFSNYSFAQGKIYVTNHSLSNFNDQYTLSWKIYERHAYWKTQRWVVYDEGTLGNFNVPAGSTNHELTLPIKTNGAASSADYAAYLLLTTKVDVADVPAGTQIVYPINYDVSSKIPFKNNPARNPILLAEEGADEGELIPAECDAEPEVDKDNDLFDLPELPESFTGASFINLNSDKLALSINAATGLLTRYEVNGKAVLAGGIGDTAGMIGNLMRNTTGGDIVSSAISTSVQNSLKTLSQNNADTKTLPNGYKVVKVSAKQYRVTLDYIWVTYPAGSYRSFSRENYYTVVYDIYSDGEIQVSVRFTPTLSNVTPTELSSILTLPADFKTVSWYGMGEGESYSDKSGSGRIGVYKDKSISDVVSGGHLYSTGSGDKSDLRWISFEREDGSGIVITGDDKLFAVNISKDLPWVTNAYPTTKALLATKPTVLRVIGQQRGVSANTLFDQEYTTASYIEPGTIYTYSFRVVPVEKGYDADRISKTVLNSGTVLSAAENVNVSGGSFALRNAAVTGKYLSDTNGELSVSAALGSNSQYWIKEDADIGQAEAFRLKSLSVGLYLSPTAQDHNRMNPAFCEMTLAPYKGFTWQNWLYTNNCITCCSYASQKGYALTIAPSTDSVYANSARLALMPALGQEDSLWTVIADENDPSRIRIMSSLTGKYLSVVDSMTYSDTVVADTAYRLRNYSPSANWNDAAQAWRNPSYRTGDYAAKYWAGSDYYITQWDLLPATSQMWNFRAVGGGYVIVNNATGKALTLTDGALTEADVTNGAEQIWSVVPCNGMYGLVNPATGMALTMRSVNGQSVLSLSAWNNLAIQKWDLSSEADLKINIVAGSNWYK